MVLSGPSANVRQKYEATLTQLVLGEAVQLDAFREFIGLAADNDRNGVLFRQHGDKSRAST